MKNIRKIIPKEIGTVKTKSGNFLNDFKKFALKGNVIELAVGVIIGAAFNGIVNSLVKDIITPPLGLLTGKVDFANLYWNLSGKHYSSLSEAEAAGAAVIRYGQFINTLIQFLITALVIFIIIKQITRLSEKDKKKKEDAAPKTKDCPYCFSTINKKAVKCPECTADIKLIQNI